MKTINMRKTTFQFGNSFIHL